VNRNRDEIPNFAMEEALFWRELHDRVPPSAQVLREKRASAARLRALRDNVKRAFEEFFLASREAAGSQQLELMRSSYDAQELTAALDVMMDERMTMGGVTAAFEAEWSAWLGVAASIMVNSGSSANLLALSALAQPGLPSGLRPGDEVILPAVAWSTTVFPVIQVGCVPVFVDVDRDTLNLDPAAVEASVGPRTRAIIVVHLLGNPCDMDRIGAVARRHGLWVVEDCCEAHGARIGGRKVGTFGDLSTFSFFFSHHMTTIEGGMISFRDVSAWRDALISLRAHGWVRGRSDRETWKAAYPDLDDRWLFVSLGYNVRPTDINAAFGRVQLGKLPGFVRSRREVRARLLAGLEGLSPWLRFQRELPGHAHSAFGFAFIVEPGAPFTRGEFQRHLEERGIETRPVVGSNFARQPVMRDIPYRVSGTLDNADVVHTHGLMIGNHHDVTVAQVDYVVGAIGDFLRRYR
jgi:CDP-6-deoxy-D-xylo-4-hexulose-3-dehydrase